MSAPQSIPLTKAGSVMVRKILHPPPSKDNVGFQGITDMTTVNQVNMALEAETTEILARIKYAVDGAVSTFNSRAILFLSLSGARNSTYIFIRTPDGSWAQPVDGTGLLSQPTPPAVINAGYPFQNWVQDVARHRTAYKSESFYLNATGFNNQGMVTNAQFTPAITRLSLADTFSSNRKLFNAIVRASPKLKELIISKCSFVEINRKGKVEFDFSHWIDTATEEDLKSSLGNYWYFFTQVLNFGKCPGAINGYLGNGLNAIPTIKNVLPQTPSELLSINPLKTTSRPAVDGSFVVHRPTNLYNQEWDVPADRADNTSGTPAAGLVSSYIAYVDDDDNVQVLQLYSLPIFTGSNVTSTVDTPWNNLSAAITLFDGLSEVLPGSNVSPPYITYKAYTGFDFEPQIHSSLRAVQHAPPVFDEKALYALQVAFHENPDSYPVAANDLGTLLGMGLQLIPAGIKWISGLFSKNKEKKEAAKAAASNAAVSIGKRLTNNRNDNLSGQVAALTQAVQNMQPISRLPQRVLPARSNEPLSNPNSAVRVPQRAKTIKGRKPVLARALNTPAVGTVKTSNGPWANRRRAPQNIRGNWFKPAQSTTFQI